MEWGGLVAFASFPLKVLQKCVALLLRRLLPHASSSKTPLRNTKQFRWKQGKSVCKREEPTEASFFAQYVDDRRHIRHVECSPLDMEGYIGVRKSECV